MKRTKLKSPAQASELILADPCGYFQRLGTAVANLEQSLQRNAFMWHSLLQETSHKARKVCLPSDSGADSLSNSNLYKDTNKDVKRL